MKSGLRNLAAATIASVTLWGAVSCGNQKQRGEDYTRWVDQYIGTGDHGHVFMGADVPYGMVQLGPTERMEGWDWTSGYHYSDSVILGFAHLHLSGTGIGDLGDVALMPTVGKVKFDHGDGKDPSTGFFSTFRHETERMHPGYYGVRLDRYGIEADLTTTKRVGLSKFTFPEADDASVVIDLSAGICWDAPTETSIEKLSDTLVVGFRYSTGWAKSQRVYFAAVFSKPMLDFTLTADSISKDGKPLPKPAFYGRAHFHTVDDEAVMVKVGISAVSSENALANLQAELPGWNFDATAAAARKAWNDQLSRVVVESPDTSVKRIFYTALYHSMIAPSIFSDVNGDYRGADGHVYNDKASTVYTTFSLWDTYRAAQPLMTILHPEMCADVARTFLKIYDQQGKLPVWHLVGNETDCMVGNPGIPVLADIVLKGLPVDGQAALRAMKGSAMLDQRGLGLLKQYGYLPYDKDPDNETVAKGLEYALADWCVAQVAQKEGDTTAYSYFLDRSMSYKRYFDPASGFMRGLASDGKTFRTPFNPFSSEHRADDYTEGNAWQYVWLVPHDPHGLISLFGGEQRFIEKLDSLFIVQGSLGADASPDISGLIGQYAHGNEPSHHVVYMYAYAGEQWKSAKMARQVMSTMYHGAPAGLCGNEDVGQMSSWYVLSAMGFYQVAPAGGVYVFGSPAVDKVSFEVSQGNRFTVVAHKNSAKNVFIQSATLNGKPYTKAYINYADIMAGGELVFEMGPDPSRFGADPQDRP